MNHIITKTHLVFNLWPYILFLFRIDQCLSQPGICQNGQCQSDGGEYWCDCAMGWTGPHCDNCTMPGFPPVDSQVTPVVLVPGQPAVNLTMERDACNYTWIVSSDEVPWRLIYSDLTDATEPFFPSYVSTVPSRHGCINELE